MRALIRLGILTMVLSSPCFADSPLPTPSPQRVCSENRQFCVEMKPDGGAVAKDANGRRMWIVDGWYRDAHISNDGRFFVAGPEGLNLLPLGADANTVLLRIWKDGKKHREVTLGELLGKRPDLERTASHFYWGRTIVKKWGQIYFLESSRSRGWGDLSPQY